MAGNAALVQHADHGLSPGQVSGAQQDDNAVPATRPPPTCPARTPDSISPRNPAIERRRKAAAHVGGLPTHCAALTLTIAFLTGEPFMRVGLQPVCAPSHIWDGHKRAAAEPRRKCHNL